MANIPKFISDPTTNWKKQYVFDVVADALNFKLPTIQYPAIDAKTEKVTDYTAPLIPICSRTEKGKTFMLNVSRVNKSKIIDLYSARNEAEFIDNGYETNKISDWKYQEEGGFTWNDDFEDTSVSFVMPDFHQKSVKNLAQVYAFFPKEYSAPLFFGLVFRHPSYKSILVVVTTDKKVFYIPAGAPFVVVSNADISFDTSKFDAAEDTDDDGRTPGSAFLKQLFKYWAKKKYSTSGSQWKSIDDTDNTQTGDLSELNPIVQNIKDNPQSQGQPQGQPVVQQQPIVIQETDEQVLKRILDSDNYTDAKKIFDQHQWTGDVEKDSTKQNVNVKTTAKRALDIANPNGPYSKGQKGITNAIYNSYAFSKFQEIGNKLIDSNAKIAEILKGKYVLVYSNARTALETPFLYTKKALFLTAPKDVTAIDEDAYSYFADDSDVVKYRKKLEFLKKTSDDVKNFNSNFLTSQTDQQFRDALFSGFSNSVHFSVDEKKKLLELKNAPPFKDDMAYNSAKDFYINEKHKRLFGNSLVKIVGFTDNDFILLQKVQGDPEPYVKLDETDKELIKIKSFLGDDTTFGKLYALKKKEKLADLLKFTANQDDKAHKEQIEKLGKEIEKSNAEILALKKMVATDSGVKNTLEEQVIENQTTIKQLQDEILIKDAELKILNAEGPRTGTGTGSKTTGIPPVVETEDKKRERLEKKRDKLSTTRDEAASEMIYYNRQETVATDKEKKRIYSDELKKAVEKWETTRRDLATVETDLASLGPSKVLPAKTSKKVVVERT
jgi:hypothetical protein